MSQQPAQLGELRRAMSSGSLERRALAVAAILLLHLVLLSGGAVAAAVVAYVDHWESTRSVRIELIPFRDWQLVPRAPLRVMAISLVMAHCSLAAIWWARTNWPVQPRTLVAVLASAGMWALLLVLLDSTRQSGVIATAWAACFGTQAILTALGATVFELVTSYQESAARYRFSIGFLLVWTSVIAVLLGGVSMWASHFGWSISQVPTWQYFAQLQGVALASALLANGVYISARLAKTLLSSSLSCLTATIIIAVCAPLSLAALFGSEVGATMADMVWLFSAQGLFLAGTLILQKTAQEDHISK